MGSYPEWNQVAVKCPLFAQSISKDVCFRWLVMNSPVATDQRVGRFADQHDVPGLMHGSDDSVSMEVECKITHLTYLKTQPPNFRPSTCTQAH